MTTFLRRRRVVTLVAVTIALVLPSCGGPSLIPRAGVARAALETSLTSWRDGKTPSATAEANPPIMTIDSEWTGGRKITSFEILREQPSELDKRFVVKLNYAKPPAESEVVYVVIGSQPVTVYREADFLRNMNMDNNPTVTKKRKGS